MSLANAAARVVRPEPDGGEYCIQVSFTDGSDDDWAYSSEDLAREAYEVMRSNRFLKIRYLRLVKEIDWSVLDHGLDEQAASRALGEG